MPEKPTDSPAIVSLFDFGEQEFTRQDLQSLAELDHSPGFTLVKTLWKNVLLFYQTELGKIGLTDFHRLELLTSWRVAQQFYLDAVRIPESALAKLQIERDNQLIQPPNGFTHPSGIN